MRLSPGLAAGQNPNREVLGWMAGILHPAARPLVLLLAAAGAS